MSLIDGLIISTINDGKTKSHHSLLMEFYKLDKEIANINKTRWEKLETFIDNSKFKYNSKKYKEAIKEPHKEYESWELTLYFMRYRAIALLKVLNLI